MKIPTSLAILCAVAGCLSLSIASADTLRAEAFDDAILVENMEAGMDVHIRLSMPDGQMVDRVEPGAQSMLVGLTDGLADLPDGQYSYEITMQPPAGMLVVRPDDADFDLPAEAFGGITPRAGQKTSGSFRVVDGLVVNAGLEE